MFFKFAANLKRINDIDFINMYEWYIFNSGRLNPMNLRCRIKKMNFVFKEYFLIAKS